MGEVDEVSGAGEGSGAGEAGDVSGAGEVGEVSAGEVSGGDGAGARAASTVRHWPVIRAAEGPARYATAAPTAAPIRSMGPAGPVTGHGVDRMPVPDGSMASRSMPARSAAGPPWVGQSPGFVARVSATITATRGPSDVAARPAVCSNATGSECTASSTTCTRTSCYRLPPRWRPAGSAADRPRAGRSARPGYAARRAGGRPRSQAAARRRRSRLPRRYGRCSSRHAG